MSLRASEPVEGQGGEGEGRERGGRGGGEGEGEGRERGGGKGRESGGEGEGGEGREGRGEGRERGRGERGEGEGGGEGEGVAIMEIFQALGDLHVSNSCHWRVDLVTMVTPFHAAIKQGIISEVAPPSSLPAPPPHLATDVLGL